MAVIVILVILLIVWMAVTYNKALGWRIKVEKSIAQIDDQLNSKAELVPKLIDVARKYAGRELELYERTSLTRAQMLNAMNTVDAVNTDDVLSQYVDEIFALPQKYPDLKSDAMFLDLRRQIKEIENKMAMYRQLYNDTVTLNNRYVQSFPNIIIIKLFGFKEKEQLRYDSKS